MKMIGKILGCLVVVGVLGGLLCSCRGPKIAVADAQMERGEYAAAADTYRKLYNKLKKPSQRLERADVAFKMGLADAKLSRYARAAADFRNALRYGSTDSTAQLRMAQMLHASGRYADAVVAYEQYLMLDPRNATAAEGLRGARMAAKMKASPTRYRVARDKLINSRRSDYSPTFAGADRIYYTTTNEKATGNNRSEVTGLKRADIWTMSKDEQGRWTRPEPAGGDLNTEAEEGTPALTPDGSRMFITVARRPDTADRRTEIWVSSRSDAAWSEPRLTDLIDDTLYNYAHPAVSPDGRWLYFVSDRPGSMGQTDIWRIAMNESGAYPENLGPTINTPGREMFPTVRTDSLLYFASDGHAGLGGLDIFRARLTPEGVWDVTNMGVPVNSEADDFGITFLPGAEAGFFSSNRGDARGYDHIYSFELPDLKISISGFVTDTEEEPIAGATVRIVGRDGMNRRTVTRDDGSFSFSIDRGVSYVMLAGAKGFMNARQEFATDTTEADAAYEVDFMLASLTEPNVVENIFYDFDRATLRLESKGALDSLAMTLRENPEVSIEMSSHTDRVGSEEYNLRLSDRRAKSVVDYLIEAGIDPRRLSWHGYGKSQPKRVTKRVARLYPQFPEGTLLDEEYLETLSDDDRAAADQINRRTEFRVTSTSLK